MTETHWVWLKLKPTQQLPQSFGSGIEVKVREKEVKELQIKSVRAVMQSCTITVTVVSLLTATLTNVSQSATPIVKVKLLDSAVLPCYERCSGVARWTIFHQPTDVLVQCNQTSCRSVKEGYQMIHDQYLQGDLSLIIPEADFSKRGYYTCDCNKKDFCDVRLRIEPLKTTVHKKVGETLVLELDVSDQVEVTYNSTDPAKPSRNHTFRVEERSLQSSHEYTDRVSLSSALELREVKESDSGVYTVWIILTKEIIHIYTVIVHADPGARDQEQKLRDPNSSPSPGQGAALPGWVVPVLLVLGGMFGVSVVVNVVQWRKSQRLQRQSAKN